MFEYFPGNYVWNLSVLITLQNGGTIGEVVEACRPIREAASSGADAGPTGGVFEGGGHST